MQPLEEVFLESDFDSSQSARQQRDARLAQLQAQGYECRAETLYTVHTGARIYLVSAVGPADDANRPSATETSALMPIEPPQVERPRLKTKHKARSGQTGKLEYDDRSHFRSGEHN